ncbi:MAG TPA: (d)CMP kinase [Acidimicrobiales bacterium]|jgi:cytidylate kinase|nr:cytidylate kinase [Euryarchaeota archaeon]MCP4793982.1 (d)CMP kinase [Actinomycetes bacterium]MDP6104850.1 (d)CMP kinase [Acidimicrobiales bacterium]MCP4845345.1 (d)CMP kinase [Actinomycetes bacterium]MDP6241013.1 (d)CMP kinase [Acidimicrobiales bacterium]|tara:strand:+ start:83 stop:724 length:642 start_codon:yes stop_codon:yes gene_type:complete
MPGPDVIAIDGPAGSGKTTIARALADRLGLAYLDTGAMYRAVAFAALRAGIDLQDEVALARTARAMDLQLDRTSCVVDGVDATQAIRGPEVTSAVSVVAAVADVRIDLVGRQQNWVAERGGGVVEGRDIGSVVFPDALLKVYLTASPEERARRRAGETGDIDVEVVAADIRRRDAADSGRKVSPLVEADGSVILDTSDLTVDEVVEAIVALLP